MADLRNRLTTTLIWQIYVSSIAEMVGDASQQVNCDNDDYKEFVHRKSANMFVCFFAKDYNRCTIIKRLLQRLYHHTQYIKTKNNIIAHIALSQNINLHDLNT